MAAGLLEFERAEVQFFSMEWIPTYNVRLSACVCGGEGQRPNYRKVDRLVYVWRRREI